MQTDAYNVSRCSSGKVMSLISRYLLSLLVFLPSLLCTGCENKPAAKPNEPAAAGEPAVPPEIQSAAEGSLGSETTVLAYGDLAKTGAQQILIANVLPKRRRTTLPASLFRAPRLSRTKRTDGCRFFFATNI